MDKLTPEEIIYQVLQDFTYGKYNTEKLNLEEQTKWKAKIIVAQLAKQDVCPECKGGGGKYGEDDGYYTYWEDCPTCQGKGRMESGSGIAPDGHTCWTCRGTGKSK